MRPLFFVAFLFSASIIFSQNALQFSIYFDYDKHLIRDSEQKTLTTLLDSLKNCAGCTVKLSGNTDADGSDGYNQTLSERRVMAVKTFLVDNGIATSKIQTLALGEQKPISDNLTEGGKQQNRRVDAYFERPATVALPPSVVEKKYPFDKGKRYSINRLYKEFELKTETHEIISGQDAVIAGKKGTVIHIPANAFDVPDKSAVKITLKEAYSIADYLSENLVTVNNDKMLQTSGMVYIEATYNGQQIQPRENLMLMIPQSDRVTSRSDDPQNDMQFFAGERNASTNAMNWTVPQQPNFSFFFNAYNTIGQRLSLENTLKEVVDTASFDKMFIWHLDSFYVKKGLKDPKTGNALTQPFIISDEKPFGYEFERVNTEALTPKAKEIAAWAAPNHSWHRKVPWKMKHNLFYPSLYATYRASDYDSLVRAIKRHIRLSIESEEYLKRANTHPQAGYFAFETQALNWINCDRFASFNPLDLVSVETDIMPAPNVDAKIIFTKMNSVLSANSGNKAPNIGFKKIPKGEQAVIVAMKIENGLSLYAIQYITTGNNKIKLKFEPLTPEEIAVRMKTL